MFENIFKGFSFIKESFSLIGKDADVIKPSFYTIFVGMFFTIFSAIIMLFLKLSPQVGNLFYLLAFLVFLGNYFISYFFTGMTAFFVYDYFKDGDATMSEAWDATKKNMFTIFYLAIISAIFNIIIGILRGRSRREIGVPGGISGIILGFFEKAWTVGTYFMIPAIVIEERDLGGAGERATQIKKRNILPKSLVDAIGMLVILTIFLAIAEVAKKAIWIVVALGWVFIVIRILMLMIG